MTSVFHPPHCYESLCLTTRLTWNGKHIAEIHIYSKSLINVKYFEITEKENPHTILSDVPTPVINTSEVIFLTLQNGQQFSLLLLQSKNFSKYSVYESKQYTTGWWILNSYDKSYPQMCNIYTFVFYRSSPWYHWDGIVGSNIVIMEQVKG